jgi:uncharacterized protein (TIGR02266 family)
MQNERIRTSIETEFEIAGHRSRLRGKIKNVSEGGLFVGTASLPEEGDNVALHFRAPNGRECSLSGMVWWTRAPSDIDRRAPGFGLRLLEESDALTSLLARC